MTTAVAVIKKFFARININSGQFLAGLANEILIRFGPGHRAMDLEFQVQMLQRSVMAL